MKSRNELHMFALSVIQEQGAQDIVDKEGVIFAGTLTVWAEVHLTQLRDNAPLTLRKK